MPALCDMVVALQRVTKGEDTCIGLAELIPVGENAWMCARKGARTTLEAELVYLSLWDF